MADLPAENRLLPAQTPEVDDHNERVRNLSASFVVAGEVPHRVVARA
jgi:hypothetical protein